MAYEQFETIHVDVRDGVARVVIDHGEINLLDAQMFGELAAFSAQAATDDSIRVVVLSSANPDFFIAHFDVGLILQFPTDRPAVPEGAAAPNPFHVMCEHMRTMPKATIAVVEGRVGGGGSELALSCDMRFALRGRAVFSQPEVALGIIPGGSGTVRLPRLIGRSRALEVVLGCDDVDADLAERWGWVNRSLDEAELWPHVDMLASRIASFPPHAVAAAKASVISAERGVEPDLAAEGAAFQATLGGPRTHDLMRAFLAGGGQTRAGELRLGELAGQLPGHVAGQLGAT